MTTKEVQNMSHYIRMVKDLVKCGMTFETAISNVSYAYCLTEKCKHELESKAK